MSVDPGIELGLTVFVTSRRYRQTNSAQALKETNRFTRLGLGLGLYHRRVGTIAEVNEVAPQIFALIDVIAGLRRGRGMIMGGGVGVGVGLRMARGRGG